jgi:glycosyltransferase involved in cell wall biosynthesis
VYELGGGCGTPDGAACALNRYDAVVVQHEYGIFGGTDGDEVLEVLGAVRVPTIVVLHTVLSAPSAHQRYILEQVVASVDSVVTMSRTGLLRLRAGYRVDPTKLMIIPHGAWPGLLPGESRSGGGRVVVTWGLLGPGKGLEWGIDALPALRDLAPMPSYVIAGQTHPRVLARDGESYRAALRTRAEQLGVEDMLRFLPGYLDVPTLRRLVNQADAVLLPYDSHEQVTSGVLIEAVASLTPVVSTAFPHARELLGNGVGALVPHGDPAAISSALRRIFTEAGHAERMRERAAHVTSAMAWPAIADRYLVLAETLMHQRTRVA